MRLTALASFAVVEYLLQNPETSQIDISHYTNVSRSMVSYVVRDLAARGVVSQYGKERMKLQDPLRLLEALSFERPLQSLLVDEFRTELSDINQVERQVANASTRLEASYALTCFAALSKYIKYYITYPTVHVYSDRPKDLRYRITEGLGAVNIQVLKSDWKPIMTNIRDIDELKIVRPIQAIIDLFCLGGAGRDGAMKLYEEIRSAEPNLR